MRSIPVFFAVLCLSQAWGQTNSATFGEILRLGGTPSDIVLDDSSVSRRHALIARRGEATVILDAVAP